jgi:hypothetical protein
MILRYYDTTTLFYSETQRNRIQDLQNLQNFQNLGDKLTVSQRNLKLSIETQKKSYSVFTEFKRNYKYNEED